MKISKIRTEFTWIALAFLISALSTICIPFSVSRDGMLTMKGYIAGAIFWTGFLAGSFLYLHLYMRTKKEMRKIVRKNKVPMPFRFFQTPPAVVTDICIFIGVAGSIYCAVNVNSHQVIATILLLITMIGIYAHFLLNGNVFRYIWNQKTKINGQEEKE